METTINVDKALPIISSLRFPSFNIVPLKFSGWIWSIWKEIITFNIHIISIDKRFIHCQIYDNVKHTSWLASFMYVTLNVLLKKTMETNS